MNVATMALPDDPYKYQTLPKPRSIRLVKPKLDIVSERWSCSLILADLESPPEYIALSYCWGDPKNLQPIRCDGGTVMVTITASEMIKFFCKTPALFWVDSLCINQDDVPEKNQQVAVMAEIYSKAATVAVWLGPDPHKDAEIVFTTVKKVVEEIATIHALEGKINYLNSEDGNLHWTLPEGKPVVSTLPSSIILPHESERQRLARFFNLPWFSRTWILQEVGLAAEANVIWGGSAFEWNALGVMSLFLMRHGRAVLDRFGLATAVQNVCHIYTAFSPFRPRATFFYLLNSSKGLKTTDPRDKVYALLSHPTACTIGTSQALPKNSNAFKDYMDLVTQFLPSIHDQFFVKRIREQQEAKVSAKVERAEPLIKADYNKSVFEVYHDVALEHINCTETLEILTAVQHQPNTPELPFPSWVPQWNQCLDTPILGLDTSNHFASANRPAKVTYFRHNDPNTLIVRGTVVSKVVYVSTLCNKSSFGFTAMSDPDPASSNAIMATWERLRLDIPQMLGEKYARTVELVATDGVPYFGPESDIWTAYMRTWVAGKGLAEADNFNLAHDAYDYWGRLWPSAFEKKPLGSVTACRAIQIVCRGCSKSAKILHCEENPFWSGPWRHEER